MIDVYQTWKTNDLESKYIELHKSWENMFNVILKNDTHLFQDIYSYCKIKDKFALCNKLQEMTTIQVVDVWRYVNAYINGGIYADIDIGISNPVEFYKLCGKCNLILFRESPTFSHNPIKFITHTIKYIMGLSNRARFYQLRQSIFYSTPYHPLFDLLLIQISQLNIFELKKKFIEPRFTYELSGPGIFTDFSSYYSKIPDTCIVEYNEGLQILDYHHYGTWKNSFAEIETILRYKDVLISFSILINITLCIYISCYTRISLFCSKIFTILFRVTMLIL